MFNIVYVTYGLNPKILFPNAPAIRCFYIHRRNSTTHQYSNRPECHSKSTVHTMCVQTHNTYRIMLFSSLPFSAFASALCSFSVPWHYTPSTFAFRVLRVSIRIITHYTIHTKRASMQTSSTSLQRNHLFNFRQHIRCALHHPPTQTWVQALQPFKSGCNSLTYHGPRLQYVPATSNAVFLINGKDLFHFSHILKCSVFARWGLRSDVVCFEIEGWKAWNKFHIGITAGVDMCNQQTWVEQFYCIPVRLQKAARAHGFSGARCSYSLMFPHACT